MATLKDNKYTKTKGLQLKGSGKVGEGSGAIALPNVSTAPNPTDSHTLYVEGDALKFWNGSSATTVGSAGTEGGSLDTAYDNGRTITVSDGAVVLAGADEDTAVLNITADGSSAGAAILIANSGTGNDITGSAGWSITKAGVVTATELILLDNDPITFGTGSDATIQWNGSVLNIAGVVDFDNNVTLAASATITQTGVAGSAVYTVTAGDIVFSDSSLSLTDADNAESVTIINNTATTIGAAATAGVVQIESTSLTTGAALNVQLTEGTLNGGFYYSAWDATAGERVFSVGENGATVITGGAGTDVLSLSAGDAVLSDGSLLITDADNANSFAVVNNTATTVSVISLDGSGTFTGTTTAAFMTLMPSGMTTGTALYIAGAAATTLSTLCDFTTSTTTGTALRLTTTGVQTGVGSALEVIADSATTPGNAAGEGVVKISADGLTTGTALDVTSTAGNALTTGRIADFSHISGNITGTLNKSADFFNVSSERTVTTGTVADDYDMGNFIRTSVINGGGTFSATGSVIRVENAVTNTSGTVSDTVKGLEIVMDSLGTGDGLEVTHAATGGKAIDVIGAATTVSDVLITGSGVKADNKASLEVVNTGATAAGGSILRVTNTGTPAAATSYLVDLDYSGATMTNNPTTVYINGKDSTNSVVEINSSGAIAANKGMLSLLNTNTGATGVVLHAQHTSTGSAANDDAVFTLKMEGLDGGDAVTEYARINADIMTVTAGQEDGRLEFSTAMDNGTLTLAAILQPRAGTAVPELVMGTSATAGRITSNGAFDLILDTNSGTNSGNITITDAANGNITLTPNGTGAVDLAGKTLMSETTTSSGAGAVSVNGSIHEITTTSADALTLADGTEGQVLFVTMVVDGGDGTLSPTNPIGYTTITFNSIGDSVTLLFTGGKWCIVGNYGVIIA